MTIFEIMIANGDVTGTATNTSQQCAGRPAGGVVGRLAAGVTVTRMVTMTLRLV